MIDTIFDQVIGNWVLVNQGTDFETFPSSKLQLITMVLQFMMEGPRPCTILSFHVNTLQLNMVTETFLLVSCSNILQNIL